MAIDIVATVIPKVNEPDGDHYSFYVFLTPRLSCSGRETLENFDLIYKWPDYYSFFDPKYVEFRIFDNHLVSVAPINNGRDGSGSDISLVNPNYRGDLYRVKKKIDPGKFDHQGSPIDLTLVADHESKPFNSKMIWRSMFSRDTPVDGWELDKTQFELAGKITATYLLDALRSMILKFKNDVQAKPLNHPDLGIDGTFTKEEEVVFKKELTEILNSLYTKDLRGILNSPYLNFNGHPTVYAGFLEKLKNKLEKLNQAILRERNDLNLKLSLEEVQNRNETETNEFHKKMAAFGNFPFLLKQAGWIWEYQVKKSALRSTGDLFISVCFAKDRSKDRPAFYTNPNFIDPDFEDNINFFYPYTAISIAGGQLDYRFREGDQYIKIEKGIVEENSNYKFYAELEEKNQQFDKVYDFIKKDFNINTNTIHDETAIAQAQEGMTDERKRKLGVLTTEYKEQEKGRAVKATVNDYSSSGISLYLKNIKKAWEYSLETPVFDKLMNGKETSAIVYGHSIHKGYRPDVFTSFEKGKVNSLCKRWVFYSVQLNEKLVSSNEFNSPNGDSVYDCFCYVDSDEGWVVESMQGSNSGKVYVDEELFRWNDWSLSADRLFKNDDGSENSEKNNWGSISIFSIPEPKTLPKLRYGQNYNFSLRFVDICGGGKDLVPANSKKLLKDDIRYQRIQGLTSPSVILGQPLHKHFDRSQEYLNDCFGEDVMTMMVYSKYVNGELEYVTNSNTKRFIGPPKLDFHLVKKHGVFDKTQISQVPNRYDANSKKIISLTRGYKKPKKEILNTKEQVLEENEIIDYFFDPLYNGYEIFINDLFETNIIRKRPEYLQNYDDSTGALKYHLIFLQGKQDYYDDYDFDNDPARDLSTITLQQGMEKDLEINTVFSAKVDDVNASKIFKETELLKSNSKIKLVHAVQKPCLLYTTYNGGIKRFLDTINSMTIAGDFQREQGKAWIKASFYFDQFPCLTSEAYILHAACMEKVSCRGKYHSDKTDNYDGFEFKYLNKIIKTGVSPDRSGIEQAVYFSNIEHSFNDTKARHVFYTIEATSRFKKFFDPKVTAEEFSILGFDNGTAPLANGNESDYNNFTNGRKVIPSSNQPQQLEIDSIVPLIRWEGSIQSGRARISDTIRIYFKGDWYNTGDGEKVAVFFADYTDARGPVNSSNVRKELINAISQLGKDPAAEKQKCDDLSILNDKTMTGKVAKTISENQYGTPLTFSNLDFENNHVPGTVNALIFKMDFQRPIEEHELGKYFIDIKINSEQVTKQTYFPFLRFAVARFQEDTLKGAPGKLDLRFSKITLTDFVQLLPYRELTMSNSMLRLNTKATRIPDAESGYILPNVVQVKLIDSIVNRSISVKDQYDAIPNIASQEEQPDHVSFRVPVNASFVIEEYEHYHTPVLSPVTHGQFQNDYTKRLVFSYKHIAKSEL